MFSFQIENGHFSGDWAEDFVCLNFKERERIGAVFHGADDYGLSDRAVRLSDQVVSGPWG